MPGILRLNILYQSVKKIAVNQTYQIHTKTLAVDQTRVIHAFLKKMMICKVSCVSGLWHVTL
jgi:hypothetical protein